VLTLNTIKSHCCGLGIGLYVEATDVMQCFIQTPWGINIGIGVDILGYGDCAPAGFRGIPQTSAPGQR